MGRFTELGPIKYTLEGGTLQGATSLRLTTQEHVNWKNSVVCPGNTAGYEIIRTDGYLGVSLEDVPPLDGSIENIPCPYIFMSSDARLLTIALSNGMDARSVYLRTQSFEEDRRLYFVGLETVHDVGMFAWSLEYDEDLEGEVYINGHRFICGVESLERATI